MAQISKFTVSVPTKLLQAVDEKLVNDETRSAVVRRLLEVALREAVEEGLREAEERADVERWVRSYTERPQTDEEFGWADRVAAEGLASVPWE